MGVLCKVDVRHGDIVVFRAFVPVEYIAIVISTALATNPKVVVSIEQFLGSVPGVDWGGFTT